MSETVHIKELADKISSEIFTVFGWKTSGPTDYKWPCVEQELHGKKRKKVHPSDIVFHYKDPYHGKDVYINTDLKSYSLKSVSGYDPKDDILSLASAVECANKCDAFHQLYIYEGNAWIVEGLLFVYNHDGDYDRDFKTILEKIPKKTRIPGSPRVFILNPKRIVDLYSISRDIESRISKLTRSEQYESSGFRAPDLDITKVKGLEIGPATIEMLIGPWLIHQISNKSAQTCAQIYYQDENPGKNDFKYLIDALLDFQLLGEMSGIEICLLNSTPDIATAFNAAKIEYASENHGVTDESLTAFQARLDRIKYTSVAMTTPPFFELELAMSNG